MASFSLPQTAWGSVASRVEMAEKGGQRFSRVKRRGSGFHGGERATGSKMAEKGGQRFSPVTRHLHTTMEHERN